MSYRSRFHYLSALVLLFQSFTSFAATTDYPTMNIGVANKTQPGMGFRMIGTPVTGTNYPESTTITFTPISAPDPLQPGQTASYQLKSLSTLISTNTTLSYSVRFQYGIPDNGGITYSGCDFFVECQGVIQNSGSAGTYFDCNSVVSTPTPLGGSKDPICKVTSVALDSNYVWQINFEMDNPS